jgi:hypothetical protein
MQPTHTTQITHTTQHRATNSDPKRGTMNSRNLMSTLRRQIGLALTVSTFCAVTGLAGATSASAGASESASRTSTAVVAPLLEMFVFGNTIGLPLACTDAGSVVSIIGAETGSSKGLSPLLVELDSECGQLSTQGNVYLNQAITESQGLALINPVVNPLIAALASGFSTVGTQYGSDIAPFGPTVAGLGGTVAFFEGS